MAQTCDEMVIPVSYTHLDVYKRQLHGNQRCGGQFLNQRGAADVYWRGLNDNLLPNIFTKSAEKVNDRNFDLK